MSDYSFRLPSRGSPRMIGIAGAAGAGKDTFASLLSDHLVTPTVRLAFADPLKQGACAMFDWTRSQLEDRVFKEAIDPRYGFSPREAMQKLGTEYGRSLNPDIWVNILKHRASKCQGLVLITDCRFENEATMIRDSGGFIVHITRIDNPLAIAGGHASEMPLRVDPVDAVLKCRTTQQLDTAASELAGRLLNTLHAEGQ